MPRICRRSESTGGGKGRAAFPRRSPGLGERPSGARPATAWAADARSRIAARPGCWRLGRDRDACPRHDRDDGHDGAWSRRVPANLDTHDGRHDVPIRGANGRAVRQDLHRFPACPNRRADGRLSRCLGRCGLACVRAGLAYRVADRQASWRGACPGRSSVRRLRGVPAELAEGSLSGALPFPACAAVALRLVPGQVPRSAGRCPSRRVLPGLLLGADGDPHRGGHDEYPGHGRSCGPGADREDLGTRPGGRPTGWGSCPRASGSHHLVPLARPWPARRPCDDDALTARRSPEGGQPAPRNPPPRKKETEMARVLYTAKATVTGGRAHVHGRTDDGVLDVQLRSPKEMGGEGGGTNPEQLFAVGYAACFEGALGVVGRRERVEVGDASIDSSVGLVAADDRTFTVAARLDVTLPQITDPQEAMRIVAAAHQVCPYSNATRGNIDVTLTANGQDVS